MIMMVSDYLFSKDSKIWYIYLFSQKKITFSFLLYYFFYLFFYMFFYISYFSLTFISFFNLKNLECFDFEEYLVTITES